MRIYADNFCVTPMTMLEVLRFLNTNICRDRSRRFEPEGQSYLDSSCADNPIGSVGCSPKESSTVRNTRLMINL